MGPDSSTPLNLFRGGGNSYTPEYGNDKVEVVCIERQPPREQERLGWACSFYLLGALALFGGLLLFVHGDGITALTDSGSIALDAESVGKYPKHYGHPTPPAKDLWGAVSAPYPTGSSWLNLAVPGTKPAAFLPYAVRLDNGVAISYGAARRQVDENIVADIFAPDLTLATTSAEVGHSITQFDPLSVAIQYELEDGGSYTLHLVKGAPFVTVEFNDASPTIKPLALFTEVAGDSQVVNWQTKKVTAKTFELKLSHGQTWLVFASEAVTFEYNNLFMTMHGSFTGTLRLAKVNQPSDAPLLTKYSGAYPVGGELSWRVRGDRATLEYTWKQMGDGPLLMFACPHHMDHLVQDEDTVVIPELSVQCMKGDMTAVEGSKWTMALELNRAGWVSERGVDNMPAEWVEAIRKQVKIDASADLISGADPYDFGKAVAGRARIGLIAEAMGDTESRDLALSIVADALVPWLEGTNLDSFVYDTTWGGVVAKMGLDMNNFMVDFANAWYCDHHFHYGYIIYAAAAVIRGDPSFFDKYSEPLLQLVQDISSYERTEDWPMARHKDFYDFHSWASGIIAEANGKSQESISEAINSYYAVSLFGQAVGDKRLEDWGKLLMTMEIAAGQRYWQMPKEGGVYPEMFAQNRMVGFVGALDVRAWTWFGSNQEYIHCINQIPFTEFTEEWLKPSFVAQEFPVLSKSLQRTDYPPQQQWQGFIFMDQAVIDRDSAWDNVQSLSVYDEGNSLTNMLYWVATRPAQTDNGQ